LKGAICTRHRRVKDAEPDERSDSKARLAGRGGERPATRQNDVSVLTPSLRALQLMKNSRRTESSFWAHELPIASVDPAQGTETPALIDTQQCPGAMPIPSAAYA